MIIALGSVILIVDLAVLKNVEAQQLMHQYHLAMDAQCYVAMVVIQIVWAGDVEPYVEYRMLEHVKLTVD
jgi:hypothetical protein